MKNPFKPVLGRVVEKMHALRRSHVRLNATGGELLSPVQLEPPIGYKKQKSLAEQIREQVLSEHLRVAAIQAGRETFEEADDFDIPDDDFDPKSPYEYNFDPPVEPAPPPPADPAPAPAPTTPSVAPAPALGAGQGGGGSPPGAPA